MSASLRTDSRNWRRDRDSNPGSTPSGSLRSPAISLTGEKEGCEPQLAVLPFEPVAANTKDANTDRSAAVASLVQTAGVFAPPKTCPRCLRTAFVRDGEGINRCINCALPQKYAVCACGHGLMAHVARGGCEAATDSGEPCECQERSR